MDSQYPSAQSGNTPPPSRRLSRRRLRRRRRSPAPAAFSGSSAGSPSLFFGCTVLLLIGFAGLLLCPGRNGVSVEGGGEEAQLVEQTIEGHGPNKILLVPISGLITDAPRSDLFRSEPGMVASIHDMLRAARRDPQVKAVLLDIDSPGGGITASDVLYHELKEFHEQTGKEIVSVFDDVAASGAYYVASASQRIVAHPTAVTGSIGVIMPLFGAEDLFAKIGVTVAPDQVRRR